MARTRIKAPGGARSRTAGDVLGALVAGLLLAALLAGIPYGLVRFIGWPLPTEVPSVDQLTEMLNSTISVTVFMDILAVLVWLLWLQFVLCVAVEVRAVISGVDIHLPAAGASQALARKLVTMLLLVGAGTLTATQAASAATLPQHPALPQQVAATAQATPGAAVQASAHTDAAPAAGQVYTVQADGNGHHETLWDIAQRTLDDGRRFGEIFDLNKGRVQPDGSTMTEPGLVRAGWQLLLPADAKNVPASPEAPAVVPAAAPAEAPAGERTVTVQQGDTLSAIAEHELGSPDAYPALLEATRNVEQSGGRHLTDPDKLFPGDLIVIPANALTPAPPAPAAEAPAAVPSQPSAPAEAPAAQAPQPAPAAPESPAPPAPADPEPEPAPAPQQSAPASAAPATTPAPEAPAVPAPAQQGQAPAAPAPEATAPAAESQSPVTVQAIAGIGALLGAGLLAVLAWRRREQQNARRPGETIALPETTSLAEQVLDRTSSPASVDLLDLALRTLAARNPDELPVVHGARVTSDRVEILVDDPNTPVLSPFGDRPEGWWGVRADRADLITAEQAKDVPAPYPGLSTIGATADGTHILANLPQAGVLLLEGTEQQVREVARGIAMEAGTSAWGGHVEVRTCGFGVELQQLLPACRVMYTPSLEAATADLARVWIEAHQAENEGGEPPLPWMVISSAPATHEELYAFADLAGKVRGQRIAAVLPAAGAAEFFPDAQVLDASVTGPQLIESLGVEVALQRVTDEAYLQLTSAIALTTEPARPAKGVWAQLPDPDRVSVVTAPVPVPSHLSLVKDRQDEQEDQEAGEAQAAPAPVRDAVQAPEADEEKDARAVEEGAASTDPAAVGRLPLPGQTQAAPVARIDVVREERPEDAEAEDAPEVQILGPLRIVGIGNAVVSPKLVLLAAYLMFRNERDWRSIGDAMNPATPWGPKLVAEEVSRLRSRLGLDASGVAHVRPKPRGVTMYSLSDEITSDWATFMGLAERGIPRGAAGILDLEAAMGLVRGKPFAGIADHSWAAPLAHTMSSRIVDTAERIAELRTGDEVLNIDAARAAIDTGLSVEPTAEKLYRAWMRIEHRAGHPAAVRDVIARVHRMEADWQLSGLQPETQQLIHRLTAVRETASGV
ncbi:LysM peptidoglycan-binding domain-containing protein [Kitasatospora purpeofusca]|uniref:LysM peptidoglycan-binding domain-containing protein n=1 Tax=Kitasatospora purpeofusca TaxID=67352 RepID=UPI0035E0810E